MNKKKNVSNGKSDKARITTVPQRTGKTGRPKTFLVEDVVKILEDEFKIDSSITDACHRAKISRERYYEEVRKNPAFAYRMRTAQLYVDRQARGSVVNAIANKRNWKASIDWLKLRNRRYKTREAQEHSGKIIVQMGEFPKQHPFFAPDKDDTEEKK